MRTRVFLSGPMKKGDRYKNVRQADEAQAALMRAGYSVINPILHYFAGGVRPSDMPGDVVIARACHGDSDLFREFQHADWLDMDLLLVSACAGVLRLPGESVGADMETAFARSAGIPVFDSVDAVKAALPPRTLEPADVNWDGVEKWDRRFLELAWHISGWSKDPSTQTGAVIVDPDGRVVASGFNGFARGVNDDPARYADRKVKYALVSHCERNAVIFARQDLRGCTLYTWPFQSCSVCAGVVIQAGIKRCVAPEIPADKRERWADDMALSQMQFAEAGVKLDLVPWRA